MAEIKNNFLKGRMNQDLDERLIPKGEYKDALNIEVSTSEGSNVGTVQTIKGNYRIADILDNSEYKCIGSVVSESDNKIYWLVTSITKDLILEWDQNEKIASLVFVDTNKQSSKACLKFGNKMITGINVLDEFLFFTDNINEPRRINIKRSKRGTSDINTHTKFAEDFVNSALWKDVTEDQITVIKKRPKKPPFFTIKHSTDAASKKIFEKVFPRFAYRYKYVDGEYSAFGPFTAPVFSAKHLDSRNSNNSYNLNHGYNTSMTNSIESVKLFDFVPSDIPKDVTQVDLLYKREDSNVVYTLASVKKQDPEFSANGSGQGTRYNFNYGEGSSSTLSFDNSLDSDQHANVDKGAYLIKSENIFAAVDESQILRSWDNVPRKARAQEITGNRLVYANYTEGYDFYPNFSAKINAGYEPRHFYKSDITKEGLPTIKSLRDYQVGVVFGDKYGRETPVLTSSDGGFTVPWQNASASDGPTSLTPMITSASMSTSIPDWADYYKFYIKETSGEYYNLLMDRLYLPSSAGKDYNKEEDHVWLSIPSSEINKVREEDYIILKKTAGSKETYASENNKYKIIDVSTEAPDAVAYVYYPLGELANADQIFDPGGSNLPYALGSVAAGNNLMSNVNKRIDNPVDELEIDKAEWLGFGKIPWRATGDSSSQTANTVDDVQNIYFSWYRTAASGKKEYSEKYRATSIFESSNGKWLVKLDRKISYQDAGISYRYVTSKPDYAAGETSTQNVLGPNVVFVVERKERKQGENFSGKFFVKILMDDFLKSNLVNIQTTSDTNRFISSDKAVYWWADNQSSSNLPLSSLLNIEPYSGTPSLQPTATIANGGAGSASGTSLVNTSTQWSTLYTTYGKTSFLDNMVLKAANYSSYGYAKYAGQAHKAVALNYGFAKWNSEAAEDEDQEPWTIENGETTFPELTSAAFGGQSQRVNSMDSIHTAGDNYINSSRSFRTSITSQETDSTYGEEAGGTFMTLSFFAPGKDLHSGFTDVDLSESDVSGENSLAKLMQGIWGGGAFTTKDSAVLFFNEPEETKFIEFESNYLDFEPLADAPGPGVGYGYDQEYKELHERQWDPTFSPTNSDQDSPDEVDDDLIKFISNLSVGKKFRFSKDDSGEIYTILDVQIKHLYNHTPWRAVWTKSSSSDGSVNEYASGSDFVRTESNSVEEAAIKWALAKNNTPNDAAAINTAGAQLAETIVNFGKAHNRRTSYIIRLDKNPKDSSVGNPLAGGNVMDLNSYNKIEFIDFKAQAQAGLVKNVSAIFETEPRDSVDLNIFYEASQAIPSFLTKDNCNLFAPQGCRVEFIDLPSAIRGDHKIEGNIILKYWAEEDGLIFRVEQENQPIDSGYGVNRLNDDGLEIDYVDTRVRFYRPDGSYTTARIGKNFIDPVNAGAWRRVFYINPIVDASLPSGLNWHNAFTFGNGIESNRIEDNFNAMRLLNGARASTTLDEPYNEQQKKHSLIFSGVYNSNSSLNNLNQFIQAQNITKDLNPTYGSIQKLFSRRADLIAFCEDRVVKILANKDAVFNADGNPNLVATDNVLGQATPFVGEFGISKNPESFAYESYRAYFTDKQRGAVLRLSMDGLTPISEAGMKDWFRDNLPEAGSVLGTYDEYKDQYNVTLRESFFENLIQNSYISEGADLSISDFTTELINNPELESGIDFEYFSIENQYLDNPQSDLMTNNTLQSTVQFIHWPEILRGSVTSYYIPQGTMIQNVYGPISAIDYGDIWIDTQDGTIQTNVGATTTEEVDAVAPTTTVGSYSLRDGDSSSDTNMDGVNQYPASSPAQYNFRFDGSTIAPTPGVEHGNIKWTTSNDGTELFFPYGFVGSNPIHNTTQAIRDAYPGTHNLTILDGEEFFVKLTFRIRKTDYSMIQSVNNIPISNLPNPDTVKAKVTLYDAANGSSNSGFVSEDITSVSIGSGWDNSGMTSTNNPYVTAISATYLSTSSSWSPTDAGDYSSSGYAIYRTAGKSVIESSVPDVTIGRGGSIPDGDYDTYTDTININTGGGGPQGSGGSQEFNRRFYKWSIPMSAVMLFKLKSSSGAFQGDYGPTVACENLRVGVEVLEGIGGSYNNDELELDAVAIYKLHKYTNPGAKAFTDTITAPPEYNYGDPSLLENVQQETTQTVVDSDGNVIGTEPVGQLAYATDGAGNVVYADSSTNILLQNDGTVTGTETVPDPNQPEQSGEWPNENTPGFDASVGANGGIPSWVEVIHHGTGYSITDPDVIDAAEAINLYGNANPGTFNPIPQEFVDQDGSLSGQQLYIGSNNGVVTPSNMPGGATSIINFPDTGGTIPIWNGGLNSNVNATSVSIDIDDHLAINAQPSDSVYFNIPLETPLVHDNFYLVDVGIDETLNTPQTGPNFWRINDSTNPSTNGSLILVNSLDVATANAATTESHLYQQGYFPAGFQGRVSGPSKGMNLFITDATEYGPYSTQNPRKVLRCVFRANSAAAMGLNQLSFQAWSSAGDFDIEIKDITVIDVTPTGTGGTFNQYWTVGSTTNLINAFTEPQSYYFNGAWVWDLEPSGFPPGLDGEDFYIRYDLDSSLLTQATGQGYKLTFNIDNYPGLVEGGLSMDLRTGEHVDTGNIKRYYINSIDKAGTYTLNFNLDGSPTVFDPAPGSNANLVEEDYTLSSLPGDPSIVLIRPQPALGFVGALNNFSIIDETSIVSGGAAVSWVFSTAMQGTNDHNILEGEDVAQFKDEAIMLIDAPAGTTISQYIDPDLIYEGQNYNVTFNHTNVGQGNNEFQVYYFVEPNLGFLTTVTDEGFINLENLEITNVLEYHPSMLIGSFAILVSGDFNANAVIDNITMTQVDNSFSNFKTVSYSESVKGWVSFKSFIPEQGVSVSKKYFTFKNGNIYQHYHDLAEHCKFYEVPKESSITLVLNDAPDVVKTFRTISYEGTQASINQQPNGGLGDYQDWNLTSKNGWLAEHINTNITNGSISEFVKKEDKWFNYIKGSSNFNIEDLYFQGIGMSMADSVQLTEEEILEQI